MKIIISETPLEYTSTVNKMEEMVNAIVKGQIDYELLWLLEHQNVYTVGAGSFDLPKPHSIKGIPVISSGRGGKYTYHGPGQLVVYIILDLNKRNLRDVKKFIWNLEEISIRVIRRIGLKTERKSGAPGVWIKVNNIEKKVVALGIKIRKWVTYHGIAINVCPNMEYYSYIMPCGFEINQVTSLDVLGINININSVRNLVIEEFCNTFGN